MKNIIYYFLLVLLLISCGSQKHKIALSYATETSSYAKWLLRNSDKIEVISLKKLTPEEACKVLETCKGIVFTGGEDVESAKYGKAKDSTRCGKFNLKRDSLEFALIKKAMNLELPIIGICRGQQILNVAMGGTLIIDIPTDVGNKVKHRKNGRITKHMVNINEYSGLHKLFGESEIEVNSHHHQAIENIAPVFKAIAFANDSIIEAIEWKDVNKKHYLRAFQWHPEKMEKTNKYSNIIAKDFIKEILK